VQAWMLNMHSEDEFLQRSSDHVNVGGRDFVLSAGGWNDLGE
jgi:hypothetical protein